MKNVITAEDWPRENGVSALNERGLEVLRLLFGLLKPDAIKFGAVSSLAGLLSFGVPSQESRRRTERMEAKLAFSTLLCSRFR